MDPIRTALTYLNSVGPFLADKQYNRHPGRGMATDHLSATTSPESSWSYAAVESSSRPDSSSVRRSQMEVPFPCQMRRPRIPENEDGDPVCKPTPNLGCQMNSLTYLRVTVCAPRRRRGLVLVLLLLLAPLAPLFLLFLSLLLLIPFDTGAVEKCHEGFWGQAKLL